MLAYSPNNSTWTFIPATGPIPLREMNEFRMQLELVDPLGEMDVRRAYRAGNQENDWQTVVSVGSSTSAQGWEYDTAYTSAPTGYRLIQFGIEVQSDTSSPSGSQVNVVIEARVQ